MNALKAAGLGPEDIDFVMCTHLHGDHVGWNTKLENGRWVPTFPKARYLFSKKEYDLLEPRSIKRPRSTRSPTAFCRSSRPTRPSSSPATTRLTTISG